MAGQARPTAPQILHVSASSTPFRARTKRPEPPKKEGEGESITQVLLARFTGIIDPNPPPRKRYAGMPADEALSVSQLRRYGYDKRQAHLGKGAGDLAQRGRPGTNSTNRYDARLVRVVDFGRALSSMSNIDSTLVQLYYCDGESLTLVSQALGISVRTLSTRLPLARRALLNALEEFNLL